MDLESFNELGLSGNAALTVEWSEGHGLEISAPAAIIDSVHHTIDNGRLEIRAPMEQPVTVIVYARALRHLNLLGAAQAEIAEFVPADRDLRLAVYGRSRLHVGAVDTSALDVRAAGSGEVAIDAADVEDLIVLASGTARVALGGSAESATVDVGSHAVLAMQSFQAQRVAITATGNAKASLWATAHLGGRLSGAAEVDYLARAGVKPDVSVEIDESARLSSIE